VAWSPDGTQVASAGSDTLVTIWDVTGEMQPRVLRGHHWIVHGVAWSPDGRLLVSGGWDNAIRLWNPATGTCLLCRVKSQRPVPGQRELYAWRAGVGYDHLQALLGWTHAPDMYPLRGVPMARGWPVVEMMGVSACGIQPQ
jgi:WD domain, G-beta repeat